MDAHSISSSQLAQALLMMLGLPDERHTHSFFCLKCNGTLVFAAVLSMQLHSPPDIMKPLLAAIATTATVVYLHTLTAQHTTLPPAPPFPPDFMHSAHWVCFPIRHCTVLLPSISLRFVPPLSILCSPVLVDGAAEHCQCFLG